MKDKYSRPCPTCNGAGRVVILGAYAKTLALLAKYPDASVAELARLAGGVSNEAMCNRLRALERIGCVRSRHDENNARVFRWSLLPEAN